MRKIFFITICLCIVLTAQAQVSKTVNVTTAGTLTGLLTATEKKTVTNLKVTGTIDARDVETMRDVMTKLANLDISGVNIAAYTGAAGTSNSITVYPANEMPNSSFYISTYGNSRLVSVILPLSISSIGSSAFSSCSSLSSVSIPASVTTIGSSAFSNCSSLSSISIPASVTTIGSSAFSNCSSLSSINLPASVTTIGSYAFSFCSKLSSINLPASITTIGSSAFNNCTKLTAISVENGNLYYSSTDGVLFDKNQTTLIQYPIGKTGNSYSIPISVKTIGSTAFCNCSGLNSISIPASVTTIGSSAFSNCSNLSSVDIPSSVTSIGNQAFNYCLKLTAISVENGNLYYSSTDGVLFDKNQTTLIQYPIGKIGNSYSIPATVTTIGDYAFGNCSNLSSVGIPTSVTTIGNYALYYCTGLSSISIPASVITIGRYAFYDCRGLTSISTNSNPIPLSSDIFYGVSSTNCTLTVPYSTKSLYTAANYWKSFTNIIESTSGFVMGGNKLNLLVNGGSSTVNVTANVAWTASSDQSWLSVSPGSGSGNNTLTVTAQPNPTNSYRTAIVTVSAIGFASQTITVYQSSAPKIINVTSGSLSSALTHLEKNTITNLVIKGNINASDFKIMRDSMPLLAFLDLSEVNITAYYGNKGTYDYYGLDVNYPTNEFPMNAFSGCVGLTSISIPSTLTTIGSSAFNNCTGLTSIYTNRNPIPLLTNPFLGVNTNCSLYVPYGAKSLYAAANYWKNFTNIIESSSGFVLNENTLNVLAGTGNSTVNIVANVPWTASSNQSWLSVSPNSGSGNNTLTVTTQANPSTSRTGVVTVSATGFTSQIITVNQLATPKKINITPGSLSSALTQEEKNTTIDLTITGTIDARDFKIIRDSMPLLAKLDLSGVTIAAYTGSEGTYNRSRIYPANEIPDYAFYNSSREIGKSSLISITMPLSLKSIGIYAFNYCTGLNNISIPSLVTTIGSVAFSNCSSLSSINIPSSVTTIGSSAFNKCTSLSSFNLPVSLKIIDNSTFSNCSSLSSIDIPSSITSIGENAFFNCTGLTSIYSNSTPMVLTSDPFSGVSTTNCSLHVPYGAKLLYTAATYWKNFTNIVEAASGFVLDANNLNVSFGAGSSTVGITANVGWTASSDQPWLTV